MKDDKFMAIALDEAHAAAARGEVPVGAALVDSEDRLVARDGNRVLERRDPTAHAEMLAMQTAAAVIGSERLVGTTLYVTLEPCAMCTGAASLARVKRVVFAAEDPKGGAVLHGPRFFAQPTCHHRCEIARAGDASEAGELLRAFFRARR